MARDKYYEARMQGMIYAGNLIKKDGIEAFDREIKKRNMLRVTFNVTESQMNEMYKSFSDHIYNNMLTAGLYVLHDVYGFGKTRIKKFVEQFYKLVSDTMDLDYMGCHYVKMEDFAIELNEKFDAGIDVMKVAAAQDSFDEKSDKFHMLRAETVIKELKAAGFEDAAKFLEAKLD